MSQENHQVLISSMLGSANGNSSSNANEQPLQNLVSRFQTSVFPPAIDSNNHSTGNSDSQYEQNTARPMHTPVPFLQKPQLHSSNLNLSVPSNLNSVPPPAFIGQHIKKFQTAFQIPQIDSLSPSKTSINSIMNVEDEPSLPLLPIAPNLNQTNQNAQGITAPTPAPKRKRAAPKKKEDGTTTTKRKKTETTTLNKDGKPEPKKPKGKKKTPEAKKLPDLPPVVQPLQPLLTTEKSNKVVQVKLQAPSIVDLLNSDVDTPPESSDKVESEKKDREKDKEKEKIKEKDREKEKEKEKEKDRQVPVIALNIPLLDPKDPKPGQADVVVNVLRLSEEKYGWAAIHPNAKSAIEIMDDMLDEDDDAMDEDEEEEDEVEDKAEKNEKREKSEKTEKVEKPEKKKKEELTEEQMMRQHEIRMNRKVGKYDYEDPFIDDVELQMEEEIATTKEGFFVYWGPLVDDRTATTVTKKGGSKKK